MKLPRLDVAALGEIEIQDIEGKPVRVKSAWEAGPAVLVFLRHFG